MYTFCASSPNIRLKAFTAISGRCSASLGCPHMESSNTMMPPIFNSGYANYVSVSTSLVM